MVLDARVCLCVGGEAPVKMHFMHYFSISDISCFMDLFKSSQVDRKGEEGEAEVRDMQNKKHPPLANVLPLSSFGRFFSFFKFFSHSRAFSFFLSLFLFLVKSFTDTETKTTGLRREKKGTRRR